jgi:heat shock protein HtpX
MNRIKTFALLSMLTALLVWAGQALGGKAGLILALGIAAVVNIGAYWFADKIVLRMYRASELRPAEAPELYNMVRQLAVRANLPMPRLYLIPEEAPNAFATGRDPRHGVVAVTQGLLRVLNREEAAGVIAHELGHIKNRDTLVMSVAATIAGALSMLANTAMWGAMFGSHSSDDEDGGGHPLAGLLGILIAPLAASLIQMAISRAREFLADEAAARFTGNPLSLAGALRKIEAYSRRLPMEAGTPATAHLLIHNPFSGAGLARLFSTHPPTEERIARLEAMALSGYTAGAIRS